MPNLDDPLRPNLLRAFVACLFDEKAYVATDRLQWTANEIDGDNRAFIEQYRQGAGPSHEEVQAQVDRASTTRRALRRDFLRSAGYALIAVCLWTLCALAMGLPQWTDSKSLAVLAAFSALWSSLFQLGDPLASYSASRLDERLRAAAVRWLLHLSGAAALTAALFS